MKSKLLKNRILAALTVLLFSACAGMTPQEQQAVNTAVSLVQTGVKIYAASPGSKLTPAQGDQVAALLAVAQQNPQAAAIASNSLYGSAAQVQAGQPAADGTNVTQVGTAITKATPPGLGPDKTAALLQATAKLLATK